MSFEATFEFDADAGIPLVIQGSNVGLAQGAVTFGIEAGQIAVTDVLLTFEDCDRPLRRLSVEAIPFWQEALNLIANAAGKAFAEKAQDAWDDYRHETVGITYRVRAAA